MDQNFNEIKKLYQEDGLSDLFLSIVHELYENRNYSLSDIASPLSLSKTTVSKWLSRDYTQTPLPANLPEHKPVPYVLSELEKSSLSILAKKASKVSRNTPQDSPSRQAARQLLDSILYYQSKHTPISQIAKAANVSRRSIYQRLEANAEDNR